MTSSRAPSTPAARALRLAGQVQVLGLASAAAVAERYVGTVDRYLAQRPPGPSADPADRATDVGRRAETLELPAVPAGACSAVALWVHNPTAATVTTAVRPGRLVSADGHELPAGTVLVPPAPEVVPGGSAEVCLQVQVPVGTPPGHYHAVVTSTATPHQALPVHLEVLAAERPR